MEREKVKLSFREIGEKRKKAYPESVWFAITRACSLPFTYVLAHTPITPNGVSMLSLLVLLTACGFILAATPATLFIGGVLCFLSWVLDCVDGEIARIKGKASSFGAWFDGALDRIGDVLLFTALAVAAYRQMPTIATMVIGILATASTTLWRLNALYTKTALSLTLTEKQPLKRCGFDTAFMYLMISAALMMNMFSVETSLWGMRVVMTPVVVVLLFFAVVVNAVTVKNVIMTYWRYGKVH